MRGSRKKSVSSDDDIDDIPLKSISNRLSDRSRMIKELRRFSIQACEFCDRKFENRYDLLVHNSKHIIIPLLKQQPQNCSECGRYCISEDHLNDHMSIKHKELQSDDYDSKSKISDRILFEDSEFDDDIDKLIQIELDVGRSNVLENFVKNCKVDVEKFQPPWLSNQNDVANKDSKRTVANIVLTEPSSEISEADDPITLLRPNNGNVSKYETEYTSIHFDDLMKPGIFHCKHCFKRFPNRYEVIVHELVHLNLSKAITNRRKTPAYKKQVTINVHATKSSHKYKTHQKSGLNHDKDFTETYKKYRGLNNGIEEREEFLYKHHCGICEMGCSTKQIKLAHEEKCHSIGTKTMQMCDACTFAMKTKKKLEYTTIGKVCNLIAKPECQRCGKCVYEVSLLRLTPKRQKMANRIKFESNDDRQSKANHPTPLSNRARLKNIQNRLKLINKYNALYNVVLFIVFNRFTKEKSFYLSSILK